jgi:hypothetical protein
VRFDAPFCAHAGVADACAAQEERGKAVLHVGTVTVTNAKVRGA